MLPGAPARAADQPALQAIDVQPLPGQQLQLTMRLSGPAPQPLVFTIDNPARISLTCRTRHWRCPRGASTCTPRGLDTILAAETKDRTRLVLNLDKMVPYDTRVDGNNIVVMLGAANGAAAGPLPGRLRGDGAGAASGGRASCAPSTSAAAPMGPDGSSSSCPTRIAHQPAPGRQPDRRRLRRCRPAGEPGAPLRRDRLRHPGASFDVTRSGNGARIAITANGDYEQLAYQSDDQYVIEVAPQPQGGQYPRTTSRCTPASASP